MLDELQKSGASSETCSFFLIYSKVLFVKLICIQIMFGCLSSKKKTLQLKSLITINMESREINNIN